MYSINLDNYIGLKIRIYIIYNEKKIYLTSKSKIINSFHKIHIEYENK